MPIASPAPTAAPDTVEVALRLAGRQNGIQTCGWINADFSRPATCSAGSTCAANTAYNVHYCCPQFPCTPPTACIDATAACDSSCQNNPLILRCTFAGYPACYTRFWSQDPPLMGFGCAPTPFTQTVWTTNLAGSGQTSFVSTFSLSLNLDQAVATTTGATAAATPLVSTAAASPTTSTAGTALQSTTSTASQSTTSTSLSPGVIAGISIGSVVAVVGLMVIWLLLRNHIFGTPTKSSKGSSSGETQFELVQVPPRPQSVHSGLVSLRPDSVFSSASPRPPGAIPAVATRPEPVTSLR